MRVYRILMAFVPGRQSINYIRKTWIILRFKRFCTIYMKTRRSNAILVPTFMYTIIKQRLYHRLPKWVKTIFAQINFSFHCSTMMASGIDSNGYFSCSSVWNLQQLSFYDSVEHELKLNICMEYNLVGKKLVKI